MIEFISKNIFMIWLGDKIPNYVNFSIKAYKEANPNFNVLFIHYTLKNIEYIYNLKNKNNSFDILLYQAINDILNKDKKYENILNKSYMYMLLHQETFYGKDIRFILLLSDIYRMKIINEFGGIYVDCDTFPLKSFDDNLLKLSNFSVLRHYNNNAYNNIADDNYFIGCIKNGIKLTCTKILLTENKWWSNIHYLINKKNFYDLKLKYNNMINLNYYIEHYFDGNWKNKNGIIRTQKCFLDTLYKK